MTLSLVFYVLSAICFFLKGVNVPLGRLDLLAMGLGFFVLGVIF